jgi:hypothetical protein
MQFDDERGRPCATRLEETSQQRLVPMADIFNVFYINFIRGVAERILCMNPIYVETEALSTKKVTPCTQQ